jgi:Fe-S-cluster containining protein
MELFKCLECGICCRDIFDERGGEKRGLTLTLQEARLFPEDLIAPLAAFGFQQPETIFLYQLKIKDCPLISQNKCTIYEKRPLVCRAFPLSQGGYSTKCRRFRFAKDFPENFVKIVIDWGKTQIEAEKDLDAYIIRSFKKYFIKGIASWSLDLATDKWKLRKRYETIDESVEF